MNESRQEYMRQWRLANPEKVLEYSRAYRAANREKRLAQNRKWYANNHETVLTAQRAKYAADPGKILEVNRTWRAANREQCRIRSREWHAANPEKVRAAARARQYGLTPGAFESMKSAQQNRCAICGTEFGVPYVDHNHTTNKVRALLCQHCNTMLGAAKENPATLRAAADYLENQ
jgi:DNA-directed RNA polymerase subunit RPC12/RpoP